MLMAHKNWIFMLHKFYLIYTGLMPGRNINIRTSILNSQLKWARRLLIYHHPITNAGASTCSKRRKYTWEWWKCTHNCLYWFKWCARSLTVELGTDPPFRAPPETPDEPGGFWEFSGFVVWDINTCLMLLWPCVWLYVVCCVIWSHICRWC